MKQQARQLTAEVISIGDEMTSGARLDTNAQWLSRRLGELGIKVIFHSTVGDTLEQNIDVLRIAAERADILVSTGGLGPTRDDLTREALSKLVDQPLEMNPSAMHHIEQMFSRRIVTCQNATAFRRCSHMEANKSSTPREPPLEST